MFNRIKTSNMEVMVSRYIVISVICAILSTGCSKNVDFEDDKNQPGVRTFGPVNK